MAHEPYRFVDNSNAPEIFCHHLHDVEFIDGVARFVPVAFRRERGGLIGEPPITVILPAQAVEPALMLTWERLPNGVIVPALGQFMRRVLALH